MFSFFSDLKARLTALELKVEALFSKAKTEATTVVAVPGSVAATLEAAPAKVAEAVPAAVESVVAEVKADL